jgi:hypothetical protein
MQYTYILLQNMEYRTVCSILLVLVVFLVMGAGHRLPLSVTSNRHAHVSFLRTFSNITLRRSRVTAFIAGLCTWYGTYGTGKSERVRKGAKVNLEHTSRARDRCIRYRYERVRLCSGIDNCPSCEFGCSLREEI